jgi:hypothetical protein
MPAVIRYRIEGEVSFDPSNLGEVITIQAELENILDRIEGNAKLGNKYPVVLTARMHNRRSGAGDA